MRKCRLLQWFLLAFVMLAVPAATHAQVSVGISVRIGPPVLPIYAQPMCPGVGYIWTPGFWAWGPDGYYWVPGTWVLAPEPGFLWTPAYWGWREGFYVWHPGYWGPHIGFYGGVHYGFGYTGVGYSGGYWRGGNFYYNRTVNNINVTNIHNTYNKTVIVNNVTNVSYNGGAGGTTAQPTREEMRAATERHINPTPEQEQHRQTASQNHQLLASVNHGHPSIAATPRPGAFHDPGVVRANRPGERFNNNGENRMAENKMANGNENRFEHNTRGNNEKHHNQKPKQERKPNSSREERPRF